MLNERPLSSMDTMNFLQSRGSHEDSSAPVTISMDDCSLEDACRVVIHNAPIQLCPKALENLIQSQQLLKHYAENHIVYGLNTGFGPMANHRINDAEQAELQVNLIRSHALGTGTPIPELFVRATLLCRLIGFMKGYSAVSHEVVELLTALINNQIHPVIPEHGGVGASGDLVQLAHIGQVLIGEGNVHLEGEVVPAQEAFKRHTLTPLIPQGRDGLAILNGVSAMTGIGLINIFETERLLNWSVTASSFLLELLESSHDPIHPDLHARKQHPGQQTIAAAMEKMVKDSQCMRPNRMPLAMHATDPKIFMDRVQEHYSIRCVPQILGPIHDTLAQAREVIHHEMNSVSDNPVLNADTGMILHGGNFHGDYVALEMDKLKISVVKLSMLCERQLDFMMNDDLNHRFPPFMNLGTLGLNLGMQGAQFTATSTTAENQSLAFPMYVHSIPTNKGNQDIVSMGSNAALLTHKVIRNSFEILAIEMIALLQAVEAVDCKDRLSSFNRIIYESLRVLIPLFREDTLTAQQIASLIAHLKAQDPYENGQAD